MPPKKRLAVACQKETQRHNLCTEMASSRDCTYTARTLLQLLLAVPHHADSTHAAVVSMCPTTAKRTTAVLKGTACHPADYKPVFYPEEYGSLPWCLPWIRGVCGSTRNRDSRIRTCGSRSQIPLPYRLAISLHVNNNSERLDHYTKLQVKNQA